MKDEAAQMEHRQQTALARDLARLSKHPAYPDRLQPLRAFSHALVALYVTAEQWSASARKTVPVQPVDATPSNALIRQCFLRRSDLFGRPRSKPSQGSVPADLTLASGLAFVFNARQVRLECCVDPLRPPAFSETASVPVPAVTENPVSRELGA